MEDKKNIKLIVKPYNEDRQFPLLGKPRELRQGVYGIKDIAIVGKIYGIPCPKCDHQMVVKAKSPGVLRSICPVCKTPVIYKASDKEVLKKEETKDSKVRLSEKSPVVTERVRVRKVNLLNGKLVWGGLFSRKTYILHEGVNYVGREDKDLPSDVSLKDEYASRRSIKIEVLPGVKGNSFKLTVENATNPILVNGQSQITGNSVFLNFGDTIVLGNTTLTFKEVKR